MTFPIQSDDYLKENDYLYQGELSLKKTRKEKLKKISWRQMIE